jgi:hypothetical protein
MGPRAAAPKGPRQPAETLVFGSPTVYQQWQQWRRNQGTASLLVLVEAAVGPSGSQRSGLTKQVKAKRPQGWLPLRG